jgi:hypothetical protein
MQSELNCQSSCLELESLPEYARDSIVLTVTPPFPHMEYIEGFVHLWAFYVRGFNSNSHCQKAFRGQLSRLIKTRTTLVNRPFLLSETRCFNSLYICGVASGRISARCNRNMHLALEFKPGEGLIYNTYNGFQLHIENAILLPIPELPRGWANLPDSFTRCCNFRFCVHRFGHPKTALCTTQSEA